MTGLVVALAFPCQAVQKEEKEVLPYFAWARRFNMKRKVLG